MSTAVTWKVVVALLEPKPHSARLQPQRPLTGSRSHSKRHVTSSPSSRLCRHAATHNAPYHPRMIIKLLLYGYCTGILSSRRTEK